MDRFEYLVKRILAGLVDAVIIGCVCWAIAYVVLFSSKSFDQTFIKKPAVIGNVIAIGSFLDAAVMDVCPAILFYGRNLFDLKYQPITKNFRFSSSAGNNQFVLCFILVIGFNWLYHAYLESSLLGTVGKQLFKLKVINVQDVPISFFRASIRHLAKGVIPAVIWYIATQDGWDRTIIRDMSTSSLSWGGVLLSLFLYIALMLMLGFLPVLTGKAQRAVHDFIAGTGVTTDI